MFEDIVSEVRKNAQGKKVQTLANEVWDQSCYRLDKYWLDGQTVTKGEAFLEWCKQGYGVDYCRREWKQRARRLEGGGRQEVKSSWKEDRRRACLESRVQEREKNPAESRLVLQDERMRRLYKVGGERTSAKRPAGGERPSDKKRRW